MRTPCKYHDDGPARGPCLSALGSVTSGDCSQFLAGSANPRQVSDEKALAFTLKANDQASEALGGSQEWRPAARLDKM